MNKSRFKEAVYKDQGLPEYNDNPLIAALPLIMSPSDAVEKLTKRPDYDPVELNLKSHIRPHAIHRLTRRFFVPQTTHIILEQKLSTLIRTSYLGRNPKTARFKRKLNTIRDLVDETDLSYYIYDDIDSHASSMTIAGISGAGKSTTINILLNTYDRVIYHPEYHLIQVPWLKVDCPRDGSLSDFCISFFIALGARVGVDYRNKYAAGRPTIGKMIADVADLCLIHAIGLLVIDEFQHMNLAKSGGEKSMINFLVTLINVVEVSIVLIGTPRALKLFNSEFRQARRANGNGSIIWDRFHLDESWEDFLTELWQYQWLNNKVARTEAITNKLYELSQGIPDIVVKLFCLAQARAILLADEPEDELLSVELFADVFDDEFSIVKPLLDALRKGDKKKVEDCNDLVFPELEKSVNDAFNQLVFQPPPKAKQLELGGDDENKVANSAISAMVSMGIKEDIARPLVIDALLLNPSLNALQLTHAITSSLTKEEHGKVSKKNSKKKATYTHHKVWAQLTEPDLRKIYADKAGSQYSALKERNVTYPISELLDS
jgi:hypothetical protein